MLFLDTKSHWTTKPYNCDIKYQCNSESCDRHGVFAPSLGGVRVFCYLPVEVFFNKRVLWGWLAGPLLTRHCKVAHQSQSQNCTNFTSHIWSLFDYIFFCFVPKYLGMPVLTKYFENIFCLCLSFANLDTPVTV